MTERQINLIGAALSCFVSHGEQTIAQSALSQMEGGFELPTMDEVNAIMGEIGKLGPQDKPPKPPLDENTHHCVDLFRDGGQLVQCGLAEQVKVYVKKDYGCLMITVTDEGNIVLDAQDGEGDVLHTSCIDPDDYVPVDTDPDDCEENEEDETSCDECGGDLEYVETKANGEWCKCSTCGHEQLVPSDDEEEDDDE